MRSTSYSGYDRDLVVFTVLIVSLLALLVVAATLMTSAAVTTAAFGGPWRMPPVSLWTEATAGILTGPGSPGTGLPRPWNQPLTQHPAGFWTISAGLIGIVVATAVAVQAPLRRRFGRTAPGHATRRDIHAELSLDAARATAEWTRPSLTAEQRRRGHLDEVAVPLHTGPHGETLCSPLENVTGTLAPTQSGKSRTDLVHKAAAAPGAALISTTKADLLEFTGQLRAERLAGPVLVFDTTGVIGWPALLRWSPLHGCGDPETCYRRAHTMVEAASVGLRDVGGNDPVFRDRAKVVLQSYFLAAARHHRVIGDVARWAMQKPPDLEPVTLLRDAGFVELARNLRTEINMVAETSDAVWLAVRRTLEPFLIDRIRELCTPRPGAELDMARFITAGGSLYLIAGINQAAQAAPVLTALAEHWLTTAQDLALRTERRRLDPPASAILDELTTATPMPQLPGIAADAAGRGVLIHWAAQSMAALENTYGEQRTRALADNTTTLAVWGGIKDPKTLQWISTLAGHHDRKRYQSHSHGLTSAGRDTVSTETVPTYRPGDVRSIRRGRVLIIHRHLDPVLARTVDVRKRSDWPQIREHMQRVRTGNVALTADGYTPHRQIQTPHTGTGRDTR